MRKNSLLALGCILVAAPALVGQSEASHHKFLDEERGAIERGEGFALAFVADRNG